MTHSPEPTDRRRAEPASDDADAGARLQRSNRRVAVAVCAGVFAMTGAAYAAVPLYELFCQVTGYGGTTQRADASYSEVIDRTITVRFDGNVNSALPWKFGPKVRTITLQMGETTQMAYAATNEGAADTVGTSTFNVTPFEAGAYFNKIDCFCFTEQPLAAGESVDMPVVFFIDPEMDKDPTLKHIKEITLSYTFFPAKQPETPVAGRSDATETRNNL
ncbi:cytochrome c oxidase assembly protein [Stappia sp. ES.058]|uniref:cytochrome c oxidase assembly protein n=1 Tax=Stappia sp. ES.058 TaxID=1881061 RepID=UPI00087D1581|nr:cytochrome c oxidase assembly protein [Stappia sp. ES.058]SDT91933.1 cytochrome c oxidase assembly protein subunit 11 [Stappia sp. ES.058]